MNEITFPLVGTHAEAATLATLEYDLRDFQLRTLTPDDAAAFRAIRLRALSSPEDARYFGASYDDEKTRSISDWRECCTYQPNGKALFGLFYRHELVGIMAARKWNKDPTGKSVLWGQAYMSPPFRRRHLAEALYKARLAWSYAQEQFERVVMFIADGNKIATEIHTKNGAEYALSRPMRFADNKTRDAHWYQIPLRNPPSQFSATVLGQLIATTG